MNKQILSLILIVTTIFMVGCNEEFSTAKVKTLKEGQAFFIDNTYWDRYAEGDTIWIHKINMNDWEVKVAPSLSETNRDYWVESKERSFPVSVRQAVVVKKDI